MVSTTVSMPVMNSRQHARDEFTKPVMNSPIMELTVNFFRVYRTLYLIITKKYEVVDFRSDRGNLLERGQKLATCNIYICYWYFTLRLDSNSTHSRIVALTIVDIDIDINIDIDTKEVQIIIHHELVLECTCWWW